MKLKVIDNHRAKFSSLPSGWESNRMRFAVRQYQNEKNQVQDQVVLSLTKSGVKIKEDLSFGKSTENYIGHQLVGIGQFVFATRDFDATPILCGVAKENGCISNLYMVFDISDSVSAKFLEYYFWGLKYGYQYFSKLSFGMRYSFNKTQFEYIPFIHPNLPIQHAIADFLDRETGQIDRLIEKKQRLVELLKEKRNALITAAVMGQVVEKNRRSDMILRVTNNHRANFSLLPDGWKSSRMRFAIRQYQKEKNQIQDPVVLSLTKSGVKVKKDLNFGKSTENYIGHQLVSTGQFVFTPRDFDATPILCGVAKDDGCISNLYIVFDISDSVSSRFLEYYFYGLKYGYQYFSKLSFGMRFSFNKTQFEHIPFIHPNLPTQRAIADFLDRETTQINQVIERIQSSIDRLREYRSALITSAVTGQIDVATWSRSKAEGNRLDAIQSETET